jgi:MFS family permease
MQWCRLTLTLAQSRLRPLSSFSYTTAIIAGLSTALVNEHFFPYSSASAQSAYVGLLTASILIGGLLGSFLSLPLTMRHGRKVALAICGSVCICASIAMALVNDFTSLITLRFILGLSVGSTATLCPLYIAEVSGSYTVQFKCALQRWSYRQLNTLCALLFFSAVL